MKCFLGETSEQWLKLLDANRSRAIAVLSRAYSSDFEGTIWFHRWRIFFMAVAELFKYNDGNEWVIVHWLLQKK